MKRRWYYSRHELGERACRGRRRLPPAASGLPGSRREVRRGCRYRGRRRRAGLDSRVQALPLPLPARAGHSLAPLRSRAHLDSLAGSAPARLGLGRRARSLQALWPRLDERAARRRGSRGIAGSALGSEGEARAALGYLAGLPARAQNLLRRRQPERPLDAFQANAGRREAALGRQPQGAGLKGNSWICSNALRERRRSSALPASVAPEPEHVPVD